MIYRFARNLSAITAVIFVFTAIATAAHPSLISQTRINQLAAGGAEWTAMKQYCDDNLNLLIGPDYAGWGWRTAVENYSTAYQVVRLSDPVTAGKYAAKCLAMMKVLARHHNYGGPADAQLLAQGNGTTKTFTLPMTPLAGTSVEVLTATVQDTVLTYTSAPQVLSHFDPIVKVSNTSGGTANYASTDYKLYYRDGLTIFVLKWLTANHPANNAAYYVSMTTGTGTLVAAGQYTVSGTTLTLTAAPPATQAVFVRYIADNYDQTGNFLGGMSSVTPDGPGYQMRTFNPGLAFGFDLLYDYAGFAAPLKTEFADILNQQIDWYKSYGYERDGDLGNYFIRGLLTGTLFTAYGTEGVNSRTAELKTLADSYIQRPFTSLDVKLPGGYGPQGQYANGVATDVLQVFSIYKDLTGQDLLSQLEWTSNIIPATIHGTKPDRVTFYDGGDWSDLPAVPLTGLVNSFLTYLPNHAMAPYARQLLQDMGQTVPPGPVTDYKTLFPPAYFAKVSGPIYARSDWGTGAVWVSLSAEEVFMDHQGLDQGNFTLQRGADYLLCDGGGYGDFQTTFHNTLLFDDRGAGDISTYPPGQGYWGFDRVGIRAFEQTPSYVFGLADFTQAYAKASDGIQNSVKMAVRSMIFIRPDIIILHDRAQTFRADVKKIFNCNFPATPMDAGNLTTATLGSSKLFMKTLVPASVTPVITSITGQTIAKSNYQEMVTGQQNSAFLHVFEATANTQSAMLSATLVNTTNAEGAEISKSDTAWIALFAKTDSVLPDPLSYAYTAKGAHHDLITDLRKNIVYKVSVTSGTQKIMTDALLPASQNGVLSVVYQGTDTGTVTLTSTGMNIVVQTPLPALPADRMVVQTFSGTVSVRVTLGHAQNLSIKIFDVAGKIVADRRFSNMSAGEHSIRLNPNPLSSGIYVIRTQFDGVIQSKTGVVIR
jgi:hypothetical protein